MNYSACTDANNPFQMSLLAHTILATYSTSLGWTLSLICKTRHKFHFNISIQTMKCSQYIWKEKKKKNIAPPFSHSLTHPFTHKTAFVKLCFFMFSKNTKIKSAFNFNKQLKKEKKKKKKSVLQTQKR